MDSETVQGLESLPLWPERSPATIPEAVRVAQVRQLFGTGSYPHSGTGVLMFFAWLEKNRPELLPKGKLGDPFQHLKADLGGLFKD